MTERFGWFGPLVPSPLIRRRPRGGPRPGDARARSTGAPAVCVRSVGSSGSRGDARARERRGGEREREGDRWRTTTAPDTRTRADAFEADARGSGAGGARTHASFADSAAASHNRGSSGRRSGARSARSARRTNQNIRASRTAQWAPTNSIGNSFVHRSRRRCPSETFISASRGSFVGFLGLDARSEKSFFYARVVRPPFAKPLRVACAVGDRSVNRWTTKRDRLAGAPTGETRVRAPFRAARVTRASRLPRSGRARG
jgi:hypothetical protein